MSCMVFIMMSCIVARLSFIFSCTWTLTIDWVCDKRFVPDDWEWISLLQIAPRLWRREMRSEPKYLQVVIGMSRSIDYNPYQTTKICYIDLVRVWKLGTKSTNHSHNQLGIVHIIPGYEIRDGTSIVAHVKVGETLAAMGSCSMGRNVLTTKIGSNLNRPVWPVCPGGLTGLGVCRRSGMTNRSDW